jgi:hypothetical protein
VFVVSITSAGSECAPSAAGWRRRCRRESAINYKQEPTK